jgi:flagellar basal-body rod protein FlgB
MITNNRTINALEMSLEGAVTRQKAAAHNMSNINTPGFKRLQVNFEEELKNALGGYNRKLRLKTTSDKHISNIPDKFVPPVTRDYSLGLRADGNNVDIDKEMVMMAQNNIYFDTAVSQLNKRIEMLKYIESDGRR